MHLICLPPMVSFLFNSRIADYYYYLTLLSSATNQFYLQNRTNESDSRFGKFRKVGRANSANLNIGHQNNFALQQDRVRNSELHCYAFYFESYLILRGSSNFWDTRIVSLYIIYREKVNPSFGMFSRSRYLGIKVSGNEDQYHVQSFLPISSRLK